MLFIFMYLLSFLLFMGSEDWMIIWISLEINMMSFVCLIYNQMNLSNSESCMKYFFIQSLSSALLLNIFYLNSDNFSYIGSMIVSFKMGAGFFYFWFPSMCLGISWGSCFVLMTFQKLMPLMLITLMLSWMVWMMMFISLIMGAWGSFNQLNLKSLMAFSSIHQIGWMMMGMMMEDNGWLIYLLIYSLVLFPVIYLFKSYEKNMLMDIGMWKFKFWIVVGMLSMAGMPPFLGFFLKWYVLQYMMSIHYLLVLFMLFMSVIMFYVYIRVTYNIFMGISNEVGWYIKYLNFRIQIDMLNLFGVVLGLFMMMLVLM